MMSWATDGRRLGVAPCLMLTLMLGCADPGTEPQPSPADGDAFALALMGMSGAPPTSGTVPCPGGGSRTMTGNATHSEDAGVSSSTWDFTTTMSSCVMSADTFRIEMSGQTRSEGRTRVRVSSQTGSPPVILELESRMRGQMSTTVNGRTMTCSHDLTQRYDAATSQNRVVGTSCGRAIDLTLPVR